MDVLKDDYEYIGWIPTLSGELVYSHASPALGYYDYYNLNVHKKIEEKPRIEYLILSSSVVDWKDKFDFSQNGNIRVIVYGKSETLSNGSIIIRGDVYLISEPISRGRLKSCPPELELLNCFDKCKNNINEYDPYNNDSDYLYNQIDKSSLIIPEKIHDISKYKYVADISFLLYPEGLIFLNYKGGFDKKKKSITHKKTSCRQSFYFLKYLYHQHSHHDHSNDSLTTIHKVSKANRTHNSRNLIYDLKKGLVDLKRSKDSKIIHSGGVVSYTKSLVVSCNKLHLLCDKTTQNELQYLSNVENSLLLIKDNTKKSFIKNVLLYAQTFLVGAFLFITPLILIAIKHVNINDEAIKSDYGFIINNIRNYFIEIADLNITYIFSLYFILAIICIALSIIFVPYLTPKRRARIDVILHQKSFTYTSRKKIRSFLYWYINLFIFNIRNFLHRIQTVKKIKLLHKLKINITQIMYMAFSTILTIAIYLIYIGAKLIIIHIPY